MTDEQIDQLRKLIQREINYELREARSSQSLVYKNYNDKAWEKFKETFKND